MNRHEKLPPEKQIQEHNYDFYHHLMELNEIFRLIANEVDYNCDAHKEKLNAIYDCLQSLKYGQEAMMKILTELKNNKDK